jgi:phosphoribosylamine--glycine ligase
MFPSMALLTRLRTPAKGRDMKVLVVGSGGREHALAWKIARSPLVSAVVCAPGNPGMAQLGECRDVAATDVAGQVALAREIGADLVVVGPEAALEAGIADALGAAGIACFGHSKAAAQIETSKAFLKDFAQRHDLPTGRHGTFREAAPAKAFLGQFWPPFVIKADGLAAGKGVVIAENRRDAEAAIDEMLGGKFGQAGSTVVIEEFLPGEEASLFALCDGASYVLIGGAQDYKRAYDGDLGPNTGGMGACSPAPVLTDSVVAMAEAQLIRPTVECMAAEGLPLRGALFAGLMIDGGMPKLVEHNARFGDPECQVLMLRLESDLVPYLMACATGTLAQMAPLKWRRRAAICVVMAADGYPESPLQGSQIRGLDRDLGDDVVVFHAGTKRDADGALRAAGGRVLNICALGEDLAEARERAYAAVDKIDWPGGFCRRDIGWRALSR